MATNTLIQSLNPGAYNDVSNRRQQETFLATEAIAVGQAVAFDFAKTDDADKMLYVRKASTNADERHFVGIALSAASAGEKVNVVISGIVTGTVAAGTAADTCVSIGGTEGELVTYVNTSVNPIVARTVGAEAGGKALMVVIRQF